MLGSGVLLGTHPVQVSIPHASSGPNSGDATPQLFAYAAICPTVYETGLSMQEMAGKALAVVSYVVGCRPANVSENASSSEPSRAGPG